MINVQNNKDKKSNDRVQCCSILANRSSGSKGSSGSRGYDTIFPDLALPACRNPYQVADSHIHK